MEQAIEGQALHASPYVIQTEKFANSLKQLSHIFLQLEEKKKTFTSDEIDDMFQQVKANVCIQCGKCSWCWKDNFVYTYQMGYEVLSSVESFGNELSVETMRKLQKRCIMSSRFLEEMLGVFHEAKKNMLWMNKMTWSREGCAIQMDTFADMIQRESKELEDSIVSDTRIEKKIISNLQKIGIRVLYTTIMMTKEGKYEIYVTARAMKDISVTYREFLDVVSDVVERRLVAQNVSGGTLGTEYATIVCTEGVKYYTLQGIARIGKGCEHISGDSFMMIDLPGGRQGVALSDGMGSGESACRESTIVVELMEELLEAGVPEQTAIQMINTASVMGREEIRFSTIDMSVFHLYTGKCQIIKAGASSTFIKTREGVERLSSTSLPVGVVQKLEIDTVERQLSDGDFVIMVTDGVMDALPVGEQDLLLETIIQGTNKNNAKELAHHILQQVLKWTGEAPADDMTVLAVGLWRFA